MKNKVFILIIMITFSSCNNNNNTNELYKSKPKPAATLYKEAVEMKGLGIFYIGKTILGDLSEINKQISKNDKYSNSEKIGFAEKESTYACPLVKQYSVSKYFIGDIAIDYLNLQFYNDTLFEITCWPSESIRDAFTKKYKEGVKYKILRTSGKGENRSIKSSEIIVWENNNIIANYDEIYEWYGDKTLEYIHEFKVSTKSNDILKDIKVCVDSIYKKKKEEEESKRQNDLNNL